MAFEPSRSGRHRWTTDTVGTTPVAPCALHPPRITGPRATALPCRSASTSGRAVWGPVHRAATAFVRAAAPLCIPSSVHPRGQRPTPPCIADPARRARRAPTPRAHKTLGTRAPCTGTPTPAIPASDGHIPSRRRAQRIGPLREAARKTNHLAAPASADPSTEATPTRHHVTAQAGTEVRVRDT